MSKAPAITQGIIMTEFMLLAATAGLMISLMAGPLGAFVLWRRMAYLGDSLSHSALLGVVIALLLQLPMTASLIITTLVVAFILVLIDRKTTLEKDAILGILAHSALALGLLLWSFTPSSQLSLDGFLFGDLLTTTLQDVYTMIGATIVVLAVITFYWKDFIAMTLNEELAQIEGVPVAKREYLLMALMAIVVAMAIKVVGVLLITALLIIPASAARFFAKSPASMAFLAAIIGCVSVVGGLMLSWYIDTPPGPGIVVLSFIIFVIGFVTSNAKQNKV